MRYFQTKTALNIDTMESIVEEAAQEETEAKQVQSVLEGVAAYMIVDILETIRELQEQGILKSVDDVCDYLYHLCDD